MSKIKYRNAHTNAGPFEATETEFNALVKKFPKGMFIKDLTPSAPAKAQLKGKAKDIVKDAIQEPTGSQESN